MKFDRVCGVAAVAIIGAWCTGARAQSDAGSGVIHLHMPGQPIHLHPLHHRTQGPAAEEIGSKPASGTGSSAAPPPQEAGAPAKAVRKSGASARPAIPFSFGDDTQAPSSAAAAGPPAPPPSQTASLPPQTRAPSGGSAAHASLSKRGAVLFSKGALDPSPSQFNGVKFLAADLATALESGGARVELDAYGGAPGDKSSDARRLSLRRALAVRQLLIDDGVPSSRIDVRAMGGTDDKGPADRVDVFIRTG